MRSQNGWVAHESAPPVVQVPGTDVKFRLKPGDVAYILTYLAARFHREVERLDLPGERDEWSWNYRAVRGSHAALSNHASGTAIDLNATRHPQGVRNTFSKTEKAAVRRILSDLRDPLTGECVIRWGEDYSTTVDGMHFEINANSAAVRRVANRLRAEARRPPPKKPDKKESDVQLNETVNLGRGQAAALGEPDGRISVEQAIAIQTATLVGVLNELRKLNAKVGSI